MKKAILMLSLIAGLFLVVSCGNDDKVKDIEKDGAIAITFSSAHLDKDHDVITSKYEVWKSNQMINTFFRYDTVPALGKMDTEDEDGNVVSVPKEYEFYITLK